MLGHPEPLVAPAFGVLCELGGVPERIVASLARRNDGHVDDR
jgi:hypothetical protein